MGLNIDTLLNWSQPVEKSTQNGPRMVRSADPTPEFWAIWKSHKETLKKSGISVYKTNDQFKVSYFQPLSAEKIAAKASANALSRAVTSSLDLPVPHGLSYLGYQKAGIEYALNKDAVLIADEMGLGKTIQAIGIINYIQAKRVLIVCPASLKLNWKRELEKWLVDTRSIGIANGKGWTNTDIVIVNYDVLKKFYSQIRSVQWDVLVADECHYLKNNKSQRTAQVVGNPKVSAIQANKKIFLTGTPIVNRPNELWSIVNYLAPNVFPKFYPYAYRYCDAKQTQWGLDTKGASNLDELQDKLRENIMVRRLKKDVLSELPSKRRQIITLEPDTDGKIALAEENAYMSKLEDLQVELELAKAESDFIYEETAMKLKSRVAEFSEIAKLREKTALSKVSAIIEHLQDCEDKVVVFAHHHSVIEKISEALGNAAVVLTGKTKIEDRQAAVDRFQNDPSCKYFIGSIKAAGVGITLTAASYVLFAEIDWTPAAMSQAEDRCHRIGQKNSVLVHHLVLDGSLDAKLVQTIINKQKVIDEALDNETNTIQPEVVETSPILNIEIATASTTREEIANIAPTILDVQKDAIHTCLKILAAYDPDMAAAKNNIGFNGIDGRIGHSLANAQKLTNKQAVLGLKIVRKYHRQLPTDLLKTAKGE